MTAPSNDINERLEALEHQNRGILRQNRILKIVFLFIPCLAFMLGAANEQSEVADKITTRSLIIENDAGQACVTIGTEKLGGYILIHDSEGTYRLGLGLGKDDVETPGLVIMDKDGKKSLIELGITEKYGPRFNMRCEDTANMFFEVGIAAVNGVPFYQLLDEKGELIRGVGGNAIKR